MIIDVKLKTPHPKQQEFLNRRRRFNVLKCGRRFGKTEICQELIAEIIAKRGIVAYYSPTYKDLYEVWEESKRIFHDIITRTAESVKQLTFMGGAKLDMWSMENPDSGRGRKYHRIIVDECEKAGKFQVAWQNTMRATLTDYKGDAYLLSTPQFGQTFFKELATYEEWSSIWRTFVYTSYDNPHLDPTEIEDARGELPDAVFRCEYLAEDLDGMASNPFAHQFSQAHHVDKCAVFTEGKQLYISIDFNLNPFAVTFWHFWQDREGYHLWGIDEAEIAQGNIQAMIELINERYGDYLHTAILTGDAMGNQRNISLKDNASHYMELSRGLSLFPHQLKVIANPTHENSRTDTNKILWETKKDSPRFHVKLHPDRMKATIRDCKLVQCDAEGQIMKRDRKDLTQRADYMDTMRYIFNLVFKPILLTMRRK